MSEDKAVATETVSEEVTTEATDSLPESGALVAESKKYRKRAQDAEARLAKLESKLAKAEADLSFAAENKGGILGKLTGAEQTAIEAHFRKEEANRIRDEMRELFLLFGSPGQWERLQKEIANERVRRKKALQETAAKKRRVKNTIIITLAITGAVIILTLELMYLTGNL